MAIYYFDVTNGGDRTVDTVGTDLPDDGQARDEAVALLPHIAADEFPDGDRHEITVAARNDRNEVVYEATLALHGRWWPGRR